MKWIVSTQDLNSYGTWVLTAGIDVSDFEKNPLMLLMHERGLPIGKWQNLSVQDNCLMAEEVFDENDPEAMKVKSKVEGGFLNACSIGIDILEMSDAPELTKPGQVYGTITKCKLREISIVDLPSNKQAMRLYKNGVEMNFADGASDLLLLEHKKIDNMVFKTLAVQLGLAESATEQDVAKKVLELQAAANTVLGLKTQIETLQAEKLTLVGAQIDQLLSDAADAKKITEAQKPAFKNLLLADFANTKAVLDSMVPVATVASFTEGGAGSEKSEGGKYNGKTYSELSKESPNVLIGLKANNLTVFKDLYKSQFGVEYK